MSLRESRIDFFLKIIEFLTLIFRYDSHLIFGPQYGHDITIVRNICF